LSATVIKLAINQLLSQELFLQMYTTTTLTHAYNNDAARW